jgi:murein DD-endopeptidase MepM/ murein hydrolase activator NlpD
MVPVITLGQKSVRKLKKGLDTVKHSRRLAEKKLKVTKAGISNVKVEIGAIENRLQTVSNQLEDATDRLGSAKAKQARLKIELDKANAGVAAKKIQVQKRIRALYKQGKPNVLEFVFGSQSSADLSTREFIANRVEKGDRRLFTEFRAAREAAIKKKADQDAEVRHVRQLMADQAQKQTELNSAQKDKASYLETLKGKKVDLENVLDELDSDAADIESEIKVAVARERASEMRKKIEAKKEGKTYTPPPPRHSGGLSRPTGGSITSRFGMRFHPILHYTRMHSGIDFGGGYGAAVYSAAGGTVISAGSKGSYGSTVVIDHGGGISTVYGHLSRISVSTGQTISAHHRVGSIGSSGLSTGPHLHFEVRINGHAVNPLGYL